VSVIAALPFTGIPHLRFSANAEPDAGLECFQGETANRPLKSLGRSSAIADGEAAWLVGQQWGGLLTVTASSSRTAASCIGELTLSTLYSGC
jgi:hypothetical protein